MEEWEQFQEAAEGQIRLLTLAPEQEGALDVIEHVAKQGVTVSIGHTNADGEQIDAAIKAGATMSTHLGNGEHHVLPRFPNYIQEQMADDELCEGLIVDGIHLTPSFVKIAVRAKGLDRSILVTDAVAPAGCKPGIYRVGHIEVELTPENRVELTTTRRLAGSALGAKRARAVAQSPVRRLAELDRHAATPGDLGKMRLNDIGLVAKSNDEASDVHGLMQRADDSLAKRQAEHLRQRLRHIRIRGKP